MKFKYFQITEQSTLDDIEKCLLSINEREIALANLAKTFGAKECLQYSNGGIAAFNFDYDNKPDRSIWKKVKHGFMPKVKTNENNRIIETPKSMDYRELIKKYNLGGEMMIGEMAPSGRGFKMHSSYIRGNRKTGFYAITVPYQDDFDVSIDESLVEIKEWEVLKGMDATEVITQK